MKKTAMQEAGEREILACYESMYRMAFTYVKNVTVDWCSEYGTVGIMPLWGGVVRTA